MILAFLSIVLASILGDPAPAFIRLSLVGGASPFSSVEYQYRRVGDSVVVCSHKGLAPVEHELVRCGLISQERFLRVAGDVKAGLGGSPPPGPEGPRPPLASTWRLEASVPEARLALDARGEVLDPDAPFTRAAAMLAEEAGQALGHELFKDVWADESKTGVLSVWTRPRATLSIDGVDYERQTPVLGLLLPAGLHRIGLRRDDLGLRRSGTVEVKAGRNTNYFLELQPEGAPQAPTPPKP